MHKVVRQPHTERLGDFNLLRKMVHRARGLVERDLLGKFDFPSRTAAQVGFGLICGVVGICLRLLIDNIWPGAGPFSLMIPVVLVATFFGHWQAGAVCLVITFTHAWYYVLPISGSFSFARESDGPRALVNFGSGVFVVILAEIFRSSMRRVLVDRDMLLRELEHRVKNNFASVASILRLQMRQHAEDPIVRSALQTALGRVDSYAIVNGLLYRDEHYTGIVDMSSYLEELCRSFEKSVSHAKPVSIVRRIEKVSMPRDQAIAVGLLVNEVVTNALKHAFEEGIMGEVVVELSSGDNGSKLIVSDNGRGIIEKPDTNTLGMRIVASLTQQAHAKMDLSSSENGTQFTFTFAD